MGLLYQAVPKGFIPRQDTGVINGNTRAREGTPFATMIRNQQAIAEIVRKNESVEAVMSTAGQGRAQAENVGRLVVRLKSRGERTAGADEVIQQIRRQAAANQNLLLSFPTRPLFVSVVRYRPAITCSR